MSKINKSDFKIFPSSSMGGGINRNTSKSKNFKKSLQRLIKYLSPFKYKIFFAVLFSILSCIFTIIGPKLFGLITTEIFKGSFQKEGINFNYIYKLVLILLIIYILSSIFIFTQNYIMASISQNVSYNLRKKMFKKINLLPLKYFDNKQTGEIISKITNTTDTLNQSLNQSLSQIVTGITTIVGIIIMMLSINFFMTLIALTTIPLSITATIIIVKLSQKYFVSQIESLNKVNGQIEEAFSAHNIIKAFNNEKSCISQFDKINNILYKSSWKSQFFSNLIMPIIMSIGNIGYVIICIIGGIFSAKKVIQVGDILSFIQYMRSLNQPLNQVAQIANILQSTVAAGENIFEFLDEKEEEKDIENPLSTENIKGNVEFKNVTFGYSKDKIIINNFSAKISSGQKIAIVGHTGCGKTTLVKLLMRFYEINIGEILIDNKNIKYFKKDDLRNIFGMVLQDTWLFNGSIKDNILYGNVNSSLEDVKNAAKLAHAHNFIKTLPNKYNMILNEEASNISSGQKQLITIARAFLKNPKILILDEATSSVDTRTEHLIQDALSKLMENRTSFIIAHRLSTIKEADIIFLLDKGNIIESGNHEELLNKKGAYYDLYNSQFENN